MYINGRRVLNLIKWNKTNKQIEITKDGIYDVSDYGYAKVDTGNYVSDKFYVMVVDYDGTEIDYVELNNGETYTLPTPPTHEGLTFAEWSCNQDIVNNTITIDNNNVMIGPIYNTTSGLTEFEVVIPDTDKEYSFYYGYSESKWNGKTMDWGDGTIETFSNLTSYGSVKHTYSEPGKYILKTNINDFTNYQPKKGLVGIKFGPSVTLGFDYRGTSTASEYNWCSTLQYISFSNSMVVNSTGIYMEYCRALKALIIPNITGLRLYTVHNCYNLKYLLIPKKVNFHSSFGYSGGYELVNNYNLKYIVFNKNMTMPSSTSYSYRAAFMGGCYSLENIVIPYNVTYMPNYTFQNCYNLKKVILPNTLVQIGTYFFSDTSLAKLDIPDSVTYIDSYAFQNCGSLKYLYLNNVSNMNNNNTFLGTRIKEFVLKTASTNYDSYMLRYAIKATLLDSFTGNFNGSRSLKELITYNVTNFKNNTCLETIKITGSNRQLTINNETFYECNNLSKIEGDYTFVATEGSNGCRNCYNMRKWDFSGAPSVPTLTAGYFDGINSKCKIVVPDELYNDWIVAENWSKYAPNIVKASDYVEEDE